jgi:TrmH family RNA methyltransferase
MELTSPKNPWIQQLRQLQQAKGRREQQAFLVEGTHLIEEALATGWPLQAVCYTGAWLERHGGLIQQFSPEIRQQPISAAVLKSLTTTETPDGVVGVASRQSHPALDLARCHLLLAVETLQDPGNLGALIRTAAATHTDALWISPDSVDPDHPKVLRASAGQWFRLPPQVRDLPQLLQACREQQIQVLATVGAPVREREVRSFWEQDLTQPTLILLGNEGRGLSSTLIQAADDLITIPMAAGVESLNVAITGALLLYEARRQRRPIG